MKINNTDDPIAAEKAGAVLKNLEKCPKNIKYMAESGYLEPLQSYLVEGEMHSIRKAFLTSMIVVIFVQVSENVKTTKWYSLRPEIQRILFLS